MAIQVWDGTKYVDAELGRFGPSGTLKEALIWDGTKYVKVWPSSAYPLGGNWGPVTPVAISLNLVHTHILLESGTFTVYFDSPQILYTMVIRRNGEVTSGSGQVRKAPSHWSATFTCVAGDVVTFGAVVLSAAEDISGTWSIVKA